MIHNEKIVQILSDMKSLADDYMADKTDQFSEDDIFASIVGIGIKIDELKAEKDEAQSQQVE